MNALTGMFMQKDATLDEAIVMGFLGEAALTAIEFYAVHRGQAFDAQSYGIAFGAIIAAVTALMKFRKETPSAGI